MEILASPKPQPTKQRKPNLLIRTGVRAANAFAAWKGERPPFPGLGGGWGTGLWDSTAGGYPLGSMSLGWAGQFTNTNLDYRQLAGDLSQSSLVMAAVNWLGLTLGETPFQLKQKRKDGKDELVEEHPLATLFEQPNEIYTDRDLMMAFAINWLIDGNVFWYKVRSNRDIPIEIWPLPYFSVYPRWPMDGSEFISHYDYQVNGRYYRIEKEDMVHFRFGYDPQNLRRGLSPLGSVLREIYSDNQTSNWAAALMRNHGVPPLLLTPEGETNTISDDDVKIIKRDIQDKTTGDERGKVVVLTGPVKATLLGFKPDELDLGAIRNVPEERLCAVTRIPMIVLGFAQSAQQPTYSNYETAVRIAYTGCSIPAQKIICRKIDNSFLKPQKRSDGRMRVDFEGSEDIRSSFDLSNVRELQDDQDKLFRRWGLAYMQGIAKRKTALSATSQEFDEQLDDVYFEPRGGGIVSESQRDIPSGDLPTGFAPPAGPPKKGTKAARAATAAEIEDVRRFLKKRAPGTPLAGLLDAKPNGNASL